MDPGAPPVVSAATSRSLATSRSSRSSRSEPLAFWGPASLGHLPSSSAHGCARSLASLSIPRRSARSLLFFLSAPSLAFRRSTVHVGAVLAVATLSLHLLSSAALASRPLLACLVAPAPAPLVWSALRLPWRPALLSRLCALRLPPSRLASLPSSCLLPSCPFFAFFGSEPPCEMSPLFARS